MIWRDSMCYINLKEHIYTFVIPLPLALDGLGSWLFIGIDEMKPSMWQTTY